MKKSVTKAIIIKWIEESYQDLQRHAKAKMGYNNNAEDALNDAIEYILKKDSKDINIQSKSHLINTIRKKFGNVMTDYFRKNSKVNAFINPDDEDHNKELTKEAYYQNLRGEIKIDQLIDLNKAWSALQSACRELLDMKNSGYTDYDISKKLNVPVGTVGSRASRCYQKLQSIISEDSV